MNGKLKVLDLFSGIGGFSLGLERTGGFETVAFCEIEPYPRAVLAKHWPGIPCFRDVREINGKIREGYYDVICGGFPCQDISLAGKGAGLAGERSGLWSEFHRIIKETKPKYAIIENVAALRSRGLDQVLRSLSEIRYDAEWHCIPAYAVGAPHKRDRLYIVAYPARNETRGTESCDGGSIFSKARPLQTPQAGGRYRLCGADDWGPEPDVCRVVNGISSAVDRNAVLGNSIVPQIAEIIGRAILDASATHKAA